MAKKGQAIQLQAEINNDEDWEKLLQRDGLIVVDIYSEWCGPCSGMTATLKKLKLEIGGDILQLAIAKSDTIEALARFRNKSEPTWMFISDGKMINFMFGANAPKLTRLIIDELNKQKDSAKRRDRVQYEISDLAPDEVERVEIVQRAQKEARAKEEAKAAKELYERRTAECNNILETLQHYGIILIFPHARTGYQEAFGDLLGEAGLTISQTEKVDLTEEILDELFYFGENPFLDDAIEELLNNQSLILLIKPIPARDVEEATDDLLRQVIYGKMQQPPGSPNSPAKILSVIPAKSDEDVKQAKEMVGVWTPENELIKATALRLFFVKLTQQYLIPEPEPLPPYYAVIFEANRRRELVPLFEKYHEHIMRYGFFTSEVPEDALLVAKSIRKYEKSPDRTPYEKMVIQLSKKKSECVLAFAQLKPLYISPNAEEGKRECELFFPEDYDEPPEEEEEEILSFLDDEAEDLETLDEYESGEEGELDMGEEEEEENEEFPMQGGAELVSLHGGKGDAVSEMAEKQSQAPTEAFEEGRLLATDTASETTDEESPV